MEVNGKGHRQAQSTPNAGMEGCGGNHGRSILFLQKAVQKETNNKQT